MVWAPIPVSFNGARGPSDATGIPPRNARSVADQPTSGQRRGYAIHRTSKHRARSPNQPGRRKGTRKHWRMDMLVWAGEISAGEIYALCLVGRRDCAALTALKSAVNAKLLPPLSQPSQVWRTCCFGPERFLLPERFLDLRLVGRRDFCPDITIY